MAAWVFAGALLWTLGCVLATARGRSCCPDRCVATPGGAAARRFAASSLTDESAVAVGGRSASSSFDNPYNDS
jgi:hypothetical protein